MVDYCHSFGFIVLSVDDPGLPRWIKLCAFGIFYELFLLIMKIISSVFYTCIYW